MSTWIWIFRSSLLHVASFQSGGKSDVKIKGGREKNVYKEYLFLFSFFYGQVVVASRKVVSALSSRADVTSRLITVSICFLWSLFYPLTQFTKSGVFISPNRLQTHHSTIPLIFGATASHWLLWFLLFFFFPDFWPDGCVELMCRDAFIHFYVAANESTSSGEFYCLFLNPHKSFTRIYNWLIHSWLIHSWLIHFNCMSTCL